MWTTPTSCKRLRSIAKTKVPRGNSAIYWSVSPFFLRFTRGLRLASGTSVILKTCYEQPNLIRLGAAPRSQVQVKGCAVKDRVFRRGSAAYIHVSLSIVAVLLGLFLGGASSLSAQNAPKVHRKIMVSVQPQYPSILQRGRFEGQVRLEATVQPNGSVSRVEVKGGNPMLCQYASEAVMRWRYVPGPSQTVEDVVFNFDSTRR